MVERQSESATLQHFVEDFAAGLVEAGLARMPARVFSCLLVSQTGRLTAAQLAEQPHARALVDLEVEAGHGGDRPVALDGAAQADGEGGHPADASGCVYAASGTAPRVQTRLRPPCLAS